MDKTIRARALAAEALGTGFLVAAIVGSGIMAERLTNDVALQLLCNTIPTGAILFVLIAVFAPLSSAHFNPAVTLSMAARGEIGAAKTIAYIGVQIAGGIAGTLIAHAMFAMPLAAAGITARTGTAQWLAEAVATFGLVLTIFGTRAYGVMAVAAGVGLYITAAYWFTASTSFANPAVTVARAFTPSFPGIRPEDVLGFITAQCLGGLGASACSAWLFGGDAAGRARHRP